MGAKNLEPITVDFYLGIWQVCCC